MKKLILLIPFIFIINCDSAKTGKVYISAFSGNVTLNGTAVRSTGIDVRYGDIVETGAESFCDIIINEKNILRIKTDTRLVYRISGDENILQVDRGWLGAVIRKKFTGEGIFYIKTPTLTAAVRGTSFCMKVENPANTYFCVCNGSVSLAGSGESTSESVTAAEHMARRFSLDRKTGFLTIDRSPGLLYHDSKGLEGIAGVINEKVDWTKPDIF